MQPHFIGGLDAGSRDEALTVLDDIGDLRIGDGADGEVTATFLGQFAVLTLHRARGLRPDAHVTGEVLFGEQARIEPGVEVVAVARNFVGEIGDLSFEGRFPCVEGFVAARMVRGSEVFHQTLADFPGEVEAGEAGIFLLHLLDGAETLAVVFEPTVAAHQPDEHRFAAMAERRMPQVVREGDGFGEVLIELERAGNAAGDGGDFHRVGEPGAEVITRAVEKDLSLVLQPAKSTRVDDPVAIALIFSAPGRREFGVGAAARVGAHLNVGRADSAFDPFQLFSRARHKTVVNEASGKEPVWAT